MGEIKERPIIFSGLMVAAILEGRKTQTRRALKPQPRPTRKGWWEWGHAIGKPLAPAPRRSVWHAATWQREAGTAPIEHFCPYGAPGDRLWVRETWALGDCGEDGKRVVWRADRAAAWVLPHNTLGEIWYLPSDYDPDRWRPSIHMPRWASRINLEVTEARVQRLQDITEEDARAEGIRYFQDIPLGALGDGSGRWSWKEAIPDTDHGLATARHAFGNLWDSINGQRPGCSWESNPWTWCISFRVVTP